MNKQTYLRKLRNALRDLDKEVVDEIIDDYHEHFENGLLMGKSEQEISNELGHPRDVAKEYLGYVQTSQKKQVLKLSKVLYFIIFLVGLVTILPYLFKMTTSVLTAIFWFILIIVGIGVVISFILIFYFKRKIASTKDFIGNVRFNGNNGGDQVHINKHYNFDSQGIKNIKIISSLESVYLKPAKIDQIQIHIQGYSNIRYDDIVVSVDDDTLMIDTKKELSTSVNQAGLTIEVSLPSDLILNLDCKVSLGNVIVDKSFDTCQIKVKTGQVKINSPQKQIDVDSSMGGVKFNDFYGSGKVVSRMGSIVFEKSELLKGTLEISTQMGSIKSDPSKIKIQPDSHRIMIDASDEYLIVQSKMGSINFK